MEKERKIKVLSLVALIVAVLGLTVAFAALSQTLTINGTASVNAAEWDIHFENVVTNSMNGAVINSEPVVNGTSITGLNATLTKPNDQAEIIFDIVNKGTINAKISSIEMSKLCTINSPVESCDWDNDGMVTQEDVNKVNDNLSFIMAYYDNDNNTLKINDTLNAGETKNIILAVSYAKYTEINGNYNSNEESLKEATELPKRNLTFNDLSVKINYVQAD